MSASETPILWPTASALERAVGDLVTSIGLPGAIALVSAPDRDPWIATFGTSDRATGAPMTPAMHTRVGSITKMFTSTIVLQLVDQQKISLDDTLANLLPSAADLPHADRVTLRHLLNMRSGIYNYTEDEDTFKTIIIDPDRIWPLAELVDIARKHDPYFEPGADHHYSNTNYILLEMIVERVTGRSFGDVLQDGILTPLSLTETSIPTTSAMPEPFAHGFGRDPSLPRPVQRDGDDAPPAVNPDEIIDTTAIPPSIAAGAGALVSTVGDLDRWLRALIDGFSISKELHDDRMTLVEAGEAGSSYGLGVMNHGRLVGHAGGIPGYTSFAGHDPVSGANVVVLVNGEGDRTPEGNVMGLVNAIVQLLPDETA